MRDLISLRIPSYTERGSGSDSHIVYEIKIKVNHDRYTIYRRYRKFRELHDNMVAKYGKKVILTFTIPLKQIILWFLPFRYICLYHFSKKMLCGIKGYKR